MSLTRNAFRRSIAAIFATLALALAASAQEQPQDFSRIKIKNFGQMDERFFRGAEPKKDADFAALKSLGIRTVIDLQAAADPAERARVEALGMRYVNIPMEERTYPTDGEVAAFLKTVDDPATGKFFLHCAGGRHRTGAMGAVYRFTKYGWDYDRVYGEMKQFDFYTRFGHGDYKKFVENYWAAIQSGAIQVAAPAATTAVSAAAATPGNQHK
jgi:protein tyrosine/serine phosphatase